MKESSSATLGGSSYDEVNRALMEFFKPGNISRYLGIRVVMLEISSAKTVIESPELLERIASVIEGYEPPSLSVALGNLGRRAFDNQEVRDALNGYLEGVKWDIDEIKFPSNDLTVIDYD